MKFFVANLFDTAAPPARSPAGWGSVRGHARPARSKPLALKLLKSVPRRSAAAASDAAHPPESRG
jgi:hypothetical protein